VLQSGFTCNSGVIPVLVGEGDAILSDELNHASIIDGIRLTRAERKIWRHADMDALEQALKETQGSRRRLVVTDGVFSMDGYVACSAALRDLLIQRARPFLFSTSHPPAVTAACIAAIDVLVDEPQLIERLWENTRHFQSGLRRLGLNTGNSASPITPVIAGS